MRSNLRLNSLRKHLLSEPEKLPELEKKFKEFHCIRDNDIERFIQNNAVAFERSGLARTYFYTNDESDSFDEKMGIVAYFTVTVTAADFSGVGRNKREKILGRMPARDKQDFFGGLLIAQFARNDGYDGTYINGLEMMRDCLEVVESGRDYTGGRTLYVDCKKPLITYYENHGFRLLRAEPDANALYTLFTGLPRI
jgi:hypothetical protein